MKILAALAVLAASAIAQPPVKPAKAPELPAALVTKVFKARSEMAEAQLESQRAAQNLQQKTEVMQRILVEVEQACGQKFQPTMNQSGDPVCTAKQEPPKK